MILNVNNLRKEVPSGDGRLIILDDVSLSLNDGESLAITGPSGSGKSTLLDLISGILPQSNGDFYLNNCPFSPFLSKEFPSRIGYVPQSIAILNDSISFNISLTVIALMLYNFAHFSAAF